MKVVYLLQNPGIAARTPPGWESSVVAAERDGSYTEAAMREIADADVLVVGLEPVTEAVLAAAGRLRLVQRLGVGYSNIDLEAAARRGIPVCNMPDFNAATVAEHTMMMVLALLRRIVDSTLLMKTGRWPTHAVVGGGIYDLQGKVFGIVGLGAIGRAVARRARAFDVEPWYHDRERRPELERELGLRYASLDELLAAADVVTLHVPLTPEARGLIGRERLARMKSSAILVNTARGALVDEEALADALNRGALAGAALDVFVEEPPDPRHPLRTCRNVLLSPHIAGQTREAMERMVAMMEDNLARIARNEEPRYRVPVPVAAAAAGSAVTGSGTGGSPEQSK